MPILQSEAGSYIRFYNVSNKKKESTKTTAYIAAACILMVFGQNADAEFTLNFTGPQTGAGGWVYVNCNRSGGGMMGNCDSHAMMGSNDPDDTPFLQEIVNDGTSDYFHLIIGDPTATTSDGAGGTFLFAQEVYIKVGATYSWSGGGMMGGSGTEPGSTSGGALNNGSNPFSQTAGNGTANPETVQIRMIMEHTNAGSDTFTYEFIKSLFAKKPKISQQLNTTEVTANFIIDMGTLDYATDTATVSMTNTLSVVGAPTDWIGDPNKNPSVTAGKYTFTPGTGPGGSSGTYNYAGVSAFDPTTISDWNTYCQPGQNPLAYSCSFSGRTPEGANGVTY